LLKTDQPAPTDEEVSAMLDQRRVEKYLWMRVLIDTNIILDFLLQREPFLQDAELLFQAIKVVA
jgi:hypothetical protein